MWKIGEVKRAGWQNVKKYYWPALVVTMITAFLSQGASGSTGGAAGVKASRSDNIMNQITAIPSETRQWIYLTVLGVILTIGLIALILKIFIGNPMIVGKDRFFMESRSLGSSAGIGKMAWVFGSGHYLNVVKIMFLRDLFVSLWTLLLVIPGIIKAYEYTMIPYILSENPEADSKDVFALTKDMMTDQKFQVFLLELSFFGWYILGALCCCVGGIFVEPYFEASIAEVYSHMRGEINGFPFNGYGVPEEVVYQDGDRDGDERS